MDRGGASCTGTSYVAGRVRHVDESVRVQVESAEPPDSDPIPPEDDPPPR